MRELRENGATFVPGAAGATSGSAPSESAPSKAAGLAGRGRPSRWFAIVPAIAVGVAVAVAGGVLAGGSGGGAGPAREALTSSVSDGALELSYPGGWTRADAPAPVPGLSLDLALSRGRTGGVSAGMLAGVGPSLLPQAFVRRIGGEPSRDDRVRIGGLPAYRYRGLHPLGFDRPLTLYVAPTSAGAATVACYGAPGALTPPADCDQLAAGLRLVSGRALSLGPDAAYAQRVGGVMGDLNRAGSAALGELRAARTPDRQGAAADRVSRAHALAARALGGAPGPAEQGAHATLAAALGDDQRAWAGLATAARGGHAAAYATARAAVARADRAVTSALRRLAALGYAITGG
jgi:hypothetical protein